MVDGSRVEGCWESSGPGPRDPPKLRSRVVLVPTFSGGSIPRELNRYSTSWYEFAGVVIAEGVYLRRPELCNLAGCSICNEVAFDSRIAWWI